MRSFDLAYTFGSYEGPLQKLIHLFKYGKVESLARPLSELILESAAARPECRSRYRDSHALAQAMAAWVQPGRPLGRAGRSALWFEALQKSARVRKTESQASLDEQSRRANLKNSFAVRRPQEIAGKRILLVDDVFTTGATLRVAAAVLKNAGATHVTVLTLARVDRRNNKGFASSWMGELAAVCGPRRHRSELARRRTKSSPLAR